MSTSLQLGPLGQVSLLMTDVARAEAFYGETLGLPHVFTFGDLAFFWAGDVRIYLQRVPEPDWKPSSVLYFLVDDIETAYRELLRRGVKFAGAPHLIYRDDATGLEEWMAFFDDSEGNMLAVMSPRRGTAP
jgi:predicted enzyme related to lactoylglutathione lyase